MNKETNMNNYIPGHRFLLFGTYDYEARGGFDDLVASYPGTAEGMEAVNAMVETIREADAYDVVEVVDLLSGDRTVLRLR